MAHILDRSGIRRTTYKRIFHQEFIQDLDLFFNKKNSNSDVNIIEDVQAVKRSVRNLVLLNSYETFFIQK